MTDEQLAGALPGKDTTGQATRPAERTPVWRPFLSPRRLGHVTSTNALLAEMAKAGEPEGTVLLAESQSAGRGRLGRSWIDPPGGSLLCSVLFRPRFSDEEWFLALTVLSLAARSACARVARVAAACKWPNDLVSEDGELKLAGVLAETVPVPAPGGRGLVVGIGLNCNWPEDFPPQTPEGAEVAARATSLSRLAGGPVDLGALTEVFLQELSERWQPFAGKEKAPEAERTALMAEYRAVSATLGREVRVELADGALEGRATDIRHDGYLVVSTVQGEQVVGAGDVVHLRPSSGPGLR